MNKYSILCAYLSYSSVFLVIFDVLRTKHYTMRYVFVLSTSLDLDNWHSYCVIHNFYCTTLNAMDDIESHSSAFLFVGDIANMQKQVLELQMKLDMDGAVCNGGGLFEWVDSILVQALQHGDWLLVDNVNFCRYKQLSVSELTLRLKHVLIN